MARLHVHDGHGTSAHGCSSRCLHVSPHLPPAFSHHRRWSRRLKFPAKWKILEGISLQQLKARTQSMFELCDAAANVIHSGDADLGMIKETMSLKTHKINQLQMTLLQLEGEIEGLRQKMHVRHGEELLWV